MTHVFGPTHLLALLKSTPSISDGSVSSNEEFHNLNVDQVSQEDDETFNSSFAQTWHVID